MAPQKTKKRPAPPAAEPTPARNQDKWQWLRVVLALIVIGAAYFYHLDRPLLWDDEADTGILARNTLHHGVPIAYDGRNVAVYDNGEQLNRGLLSKKTPWVQYYVGALSLKLFGDDTAGLRLLFAIVGLAAFLPIHAVLKKYSRYPELLATLALISPQVVLFQRNARYYSLLILLYAALVWHLSSPSRKPLRGFLGATAILILFFHTHPFAAGCCAVSLVAYCLLARREALVLYTGACAVGFASWLIWYVWLGPSPAETSLFVALNGPAGWSGSLWRGLKANIIDFDAIGCLPALLCAGVAAMLFSQGGAAARKWIKDPIPTFILLTVVIQAALTSALLGTETAAQYSFLRYVPHLVVFGFVAGFVLLSKVIRSPAILLSTCIVMIALNIFTLSFWLQPSGRTVPASWMQAVYSEILWPRETAWEETVRRLETQPQGPHGAQTLMLGVPAWTQGMLIFYAGDRYVVRPILNAPFEGITGVLNDVLGKDAATRLSGAPEWVVDSLNALRTAPPGYAEVASIPSYRTRPDDGARPELTRHAFGRADTVKSIRLFHLQTDDVMRR